jgi:serine/threonine protein kinase
MDGGTLLGHVRRQGTLTTDEAVEILEPIVGALTEAHSRGIVHRDIKPTNILFGSAGPNRVVKLADFGIAKAVIQSEKSASGVIKGKFAYMSPEQAHGRPLDGRSDLFSVGTVLYLLVTGRKPFDGPTDADVLMQVRRARPDKPSKFVRDLNPDAERLIKRALRADPGKRWQSAEQMADRIDAILVKLGQPSGPAPLKRWLETLSARDGARPPVADPAAASDRSIAVDLGSADLELEEVAATNVEEDRGTGVDTDPLAPPTRAEATVHNAPTRPLPPVAATAGARFRRWARRMTISAALIFVALGGAFYFARPHLPAWATQPIDRLLQRLHVPFGAR